jgi:hypothetical protein
MTSKFKQRTPVVDGVDLHSLDTQAAEIAAFSTLVGAKSFSIDLQNNSATLSVPPASPDMPLQSITVRPGQVISRINGVIYVQDRDAFLLTYELDIG